MTMFNPGDVVLLSFRFTSGPAKQRLALVVLDSGDDDLIVARITTQHYTTPFDVIVGDWRGAGLLAPSTIRTHKLATIEKTLVREKLGALSGEDWFRVQTAVRQILP